MKKLFINCNFRRVSLNRIEEANEIINEYKADGLTLTLRQLYYQFVARGLMENKKTNYDNLGALISKARLAGLVDWDAIEDRTRFLRGLSNWNSPSEMINYQSRTYTIPMWEGQDNCIEVWIEKDALIGVIEGVCRDNDVDYFACRGYVSQSELYKAGTRIARRLKYENQKTTILHLGDHDPSGMDMTRDNQDRINMFAGYNVELRRIALNMNQIRTYKPPPNPAKESDCRAKAYIAEYGASSWELDALEPRVLSKLIQDTVDEYKDMGLWAEREKLHKKHLKLLKKAVKYINKKEA